MQITVIVIAWLLSAYTAFAFYKAGMGKLRTPAATLLANGYGWIAKFPKGTSKFIGAAELLGAIGVIAGPLGSQAFGLSWSLGLGVGAAAGLATIMFLANLTHIVRKEFKYTYKMGLQLFAATLVLTILLAIYPSI